MVLAVGTWIRGFGSNAPPGKGLPISPTLDLRYYDLVAMMPVVLCDSAGIGGLVRYGGDILHVTHACPCLAQALHGMHE